MNKKLVEAAKVIYQAFPSSHSCLKYDRDEDFEKMNFIIYGNDALSAQMYKEVQTVYFYTWRRVECNTNPDVVSEQEAQELWQAICELREMLHNGIVVMNGKMCRCLMEKYNFLSDKDIARGRVSVMLTGLSNDPLAQMICSVKTDADEEMVKIGQISEIAAQNLYGNFALTDNDNLLSFCEYPLTVLYAAYAWHKILHRYGHAPSMILAESENTALMLLLWRRLGVDDNCVRIVPRDLSPFSEKNGLYRNLCVFAPRYAALGIKQRLSQMPEFKHEPPLFYILDETFDKAVKAAESERSFYQSFKASVDTLKELRNKTLRGAYYGTANNVLTLMSALKTFDELYNVNAKGKTADVRSATDKLIFAHTDKIRSFFSAE